MSGAIDNSKDQKFNNISAEDEALLQGKDPLESSSWPFLRLFITWCAAVICGGYSPGMSLFALVFQKAGVLRSLCDDHKTCDDQYISITNILNVLNAVLLLWMFFGGLVFDALGSRVVGVCGALLVAASVILLILAIRTDLLWLFVMAIALGDVGALMNNFGFYGFLFHLPGWQGLVIALSNGCMQASSYLPVALQELMRLTKCSFITSLVVFGIVVLASALMTYFAVPSQAEYFAQAQAVVGLPLAKPKASWSKLGSATKGAWRVLRSQGWTAHVIVALVLAVNVTNAVYSTLAVPFGTALFGDEDDGDALGSLYLEISALQGLILVPITGILVDFFGLRMLAASLSIILLGFVIFIGKASWAAQAVASFFSAFSQNVWMLFTMKYLVAFAPPDRLGAVQALCSGIIGMCGLPLIVGAATFVSQGDAANGFNLERCLAVTHGFGVTACIGWAAYLLYMLRAPETTMTLLEEDEKEVVKRFGVTSLEHACEVMDMDRQELLKIVSSSDVLEQREVLKRYKDPKTQARYMQLAKRKADAITQPALEVVRELGTDGVIIRTGTPEEVIPAALQAFGGGSGERGEPTFEYLWKDITDGGEKARLDFFQGWLGMQVHVGHRFGHSLVIGNPVEAVCICYPPNCLEDGEAMLFGGERWMYGVDKMGNNMLSSQTSMKALERFLVVQNIEMDKRHREQPPHWYIAVLGVVPGNRGKKRGKILLDLIAQWAKRDGVACYLECGDVNVPIYERCGYRTVFSERDDSEPGNPLSMHGMLRDVGSCANSLPLGSGSP